MHKINSAKFYQKKINKRSLIDRIFHYDLPVFPLILTETLAEYPLIHMSFSLGTEIYKLEIFKYLPIAKISTHKIL